MLRADNTLSAKVTRIVSVNLNVQVINEKKASPRTQVKEMLAIGVFVDLI